MADTRKPILDRIWPRVLAATGVGLAILLSWWWKVQDAHPQTTIHAVAFSEPIDLGRGHLTPTSLTFHSSGDRAGQLILTAIAENTTGETQVSIFGFPEKSPELVIQDIRKLPDKVVLVRDDESLQQLQPRMSEPLEIIWNLPESWQPQEVDIEFNRQLFKKKDNLLGKSSWLGFQHAGRLTATPEPRP